jgi:pumilio RNA-binding family
LIISDLSAMAGSRVQRAQGTKEHWCSAGVRGRVQQRKARNRFLATGGCPAVSAAKIVVPHFLSNSEVQADCSHINGTFQAGGELGVFYVGATNATMPTSWADIEDFPVTSSPVAQVIDATILANSPDQSAAIIDLLDGPSDTDKHAVLLQLPSIAKQLSLSRNGCRIVQKAIEVAGGFDRDRLIASLRDHVTELYESPHGNHVLSKAIEVLPASKIHFVISALLGRGLAVSKHRFGCRIVCRLIEHCNDEVIGELLDEILSETDLLARHSFGNFVIQTAMEHVSPVRRAVMLSQLLPDFTSLAMHRTGSLVAQRVLDYCDDAGQISAIRVLVQGQDTASITNVACNRYGSYVLEQLAALHNIARTEAANILYRDLQLLEGSEYAEKVILAFGLRPTESLASTA